MKKLLIVFFVAVLIFSSFITVSAAENDADLVVTGDFNKDTKILTVHASVNNIKPEYGIIIVEYHINYDKNELALMEANVNMPDLWKPHVESQNAENLSRRVADGKYSWSIVMAKVKLGIKEDEQLTIDLKFKVKQETDISVRFDRIVVATEVPFKYNGKTMYEPTEISVNDATLEFDSRTSNGNDVSVDNNDVSKEPVNPPTNNTTSQPSTPTTSEPSDIPDIPLTSEEPDISVESDPVESEEPNVSLDSETPESENPTVSENPIESEAPSTSDVPSVSDDPATSDEPNNTVSNDGENSDVSHTDENSDEIADASENVSDSNGEGIIVMPEINNSKDDSDPTTNESTTDESDADINFEEDHSDMIQTIIWIVVGVLGAAIIAISAVLFVRKSKKVDPDA